MRKVAWVTGASRGMGRNTAIELARAGFDIALTARDQCLLDEAASEIEEAGGTTFSSAADLTDRRSVVQFAEAAAERFGRCDLVCNIGIYQGPGGRRLFLDTPAEELSISFEADVVAPAVLCQIAISLMLERGGGTIINMSSSSVVMNPPGTVEESGWSFAYVGAKAALDRLASIINVELGAAGIRAFTAEPGFVAYGERLRDMLEKYPGMPVSPPEAIGPAIVWLVESPDATRLLTKRVSLPGLTHKLHLLEGCQGPGSVYP